MLKAANGSKNGEASLIRIRRDLDGLRVRSPSSIEIWLIFNGMRHYIVSPTVYDALFHNHDIRDLPDVEKLMRGPDLVDGTVLVRGSDGRIFLVTAVAADNIRRYLISDWPTFQALDFDISLVVDVPDIVISAVLVAPSITISRSIKQS